MPVDQEQNGLSAEPVDDLDAAIASLKDSINVSEGSSAQEPDPSESENDDTDTDAETEESEDNSEESVPGEPVEVEPDEEDTSTVEDKPLSRRTRAKLYEEFKAQAEKEREENEKLREQLDKIQAEDAKRQELITKALGTNEDYKKALEDMTSADPKISDPAKKKFKIYTANREFYGELMKGAERDINARLAKDFWAAADERPGIDKQHITTASMKDVLLHYYDQGASHAEAAAAKREEALQKTIETQKAEIKELRSGKVASKASPVKGGKPSSGGSKLESVLGADGLPTDEAIQAGRNGKLDFLKL